MIKIVVQSGPLEGRVFLPPPGTSVEIGRDPQCFVRLESGGVSRRHAVLFPEGNEWHIRDAGSQNGTYVNGHRIDRVVLRSGDTIRIGKEELTYWREEQDPWIGRSIAGYRILERLGSGGAGTVYRAIQIALDRPVAVKVLSEELAGDEEFVSRFVQEARAMARVSHPHVAQVHNVGQHGSTYYLSMEYLKGGSLRDLLDREGPLAPRRATRLMLDAVRALLWAEQQGIVHRDIKPGNLLLDENGHVKVADFGLAADLVLSRARDEGLVIGSPQFMAPEQALGKTPDHRADIYALGSTLYNTLSGKNAFEGKSVKEVLLAKMHGDPVPLSAVAPGVPPELQSVVARAMSRDPEARQQTALELFRDLQRLAETLPAEKERPRRGSTALSPGTATRRKARRARRPRIATYALRALIVAGGVALLFWLSGGGEPEPAGPGEVVVRQTPEPKGKDPGRGAAGNAADAEPFEEGATPVETTIGDEDPPGEVPGPATEAGSAGAEVPRGSEVPGNPQAPDRLADAREALRSLVDHTVQLLVLENRFQEARVRLREFQGEYPELAGEVAAELGTVQGAESLFEARKRALALERAGDLAAAREVLASCVDDLPEPYRGEARLAIESIRKKEESSSGK